MVPNMRDHGDVNFQYSYISFVYFSVELWCIAYVIDPKSFHIYTYKILAGTIYMSLFWIRSHQQLAAEYHHCDELRPNRINVECNQQFVCKKYYDYS